MAASRRGAASGDPGTLVIGAWRTSSRATEYLVAQLPDAVWKAPLPDLPRRTVRSIAAHLHNSRASWIRTLGGEHGIEAPALVNVHRATRREVIAALRRSSRGIEALLRLGLTNGGALPASRRYVWRNLPLDVPHVLTYFAAHEAHHRGQLLMLARQMGHPLPRAVAAGVWQFTRLSARSSRSRARR